MNVRTNQTLLFVTENVEKGSNVAITNAGNTVVIIKTNPRSIFV